MRENVSLLAFNRGLVSRLGLARADIKRMAMAAETYLNFMPRVLGSMMLRTGLRYIGSSKSNAAARFLPFVFSTTDKAKVELTDLVLRVWIGDTVITRPSVSSAVTDGTFVSDASTNAAWTDDDEAGCTSAWHAATGALGLTGNGTLSARRTQQITVAAASQNVEHALRIIILRGPVILRVGSTAGDDDYIEETSLDEGTHSLALTPTGNFHIRFQSSLARIVLVSSCTIEAAVAMEVTTPWSAANLTNIKYDQSGDIIFCSCPGIQQYKIERRETRSWSVVKYQPEDGPFLVANTSTMTMTPSVLTGNGTLTAARAYFKSTMVGRLMAVTSTGQTVTSTFTAATQATNSILVEGITTTRAFTVVLDFSGAGTTVVLQRSFDNSIWADVSGKSWTVDTTESYTDGLDNQTVYYRLYCSVYATSVTTAKLTIATGSIRGIGRVTAYTSSTVVSVEVLSAFGGTTAVDDWEAGKWSDYLGWPTAVCFAEGRLWWFGKDSAIGSVSDAFYSFDHEVTGDSAPINRTIGSGPVDTINWGLPLQRLILGGQSAEHSCRSNSLDEPLTPSNFNIKTSSTNGSSNAQAVKVDDKGVFVQSGGVRVYELNFESGADYMSEHLSALIPTIGSPGIIRMAVQRQPDTRVHCLRSDGTVAVLIYDKLENVICWINLSSTGASGLIEDVFVLPGDVGDEEDQVFYLVNRTIGGATKRYLEQLSFEEDCVGGNLNKQADSFVAYSGASTTSITGLGHLEGKQVVVWADGQDVGYNSSDALIYTVASGAITLATAATNVIVGLPYQARWKSGKLVQLKGGDALKSIKQIKGLGLILADTHHKGLKFGKDFDNMNDLPSVEYGKAVTAGTIYADYDESPFVFPGSWTTDQRLCLEANAPRPVTILAAICDTELNG